MPEKHPFARTPVIHFSDAHPATRWLWPGRLGLVWGFDRIGGIGMVHHGMELATYAIFNFFAPSQLYSTHLLGVWRDVRRAAQLCSSCHPRHLLVYGPAQKVLVPHFPLRTLTLAAQSLRWPLHSHRYERRCWSSEIGGATVAPANFIQR